MRKNQNLISKVAKAFPIDRERLMIGSVVLTFASVLVTPACGQLNLSNPMFIMSFFFPVQGFVLAVCMQLEEKDDDLTLLLQCLILGLLAFSTGLVIFFQALPGKSDLEGMSVAGLVCGLSISGMLNIWRGAMLSKGKLRKRAEVRKLQKQQFEEASARFVAEDALMADLTDFLADNDQSGRSNA